MKPRFRTPRPPRAFTLVELLVSTAVLVLMVVMLVNMVNQTSRIWRSANTKIVAFQDARVAFESMTRNIGQATLNTYYEYFDDKGLTPNDYTSTFTPASYGRFSELHFITGQSSVLVPAPDASATYTSTPAGHAIFFQAPLGYVDPSPAAALPTGATEMVSQLNAVGYYLEFSSDKRSLPPMVPATNVSYRYRLMEFIQPTESLQVYSETWKNRSANKQADWFKTPLQSQNSQTTHAMAPNIVALVIRPKRADAEQAAMTSPTPVCVDYNYDSHPYATGALVTAAGATPTTLALQQHQLPSLVAVTLVAIDEVSASRLAKTYGTVAPLTMLKGSDGKALSTLFQTCTDTNDVSSTSDYNTDLRTLVSALSAARLTYRVFDTEVIIRDSKWTEK